MPIDFKWFAVLLILMIAAIVYVRTMRVHARASWREIAFPWSRSVARGGQDKQQKGPAQLF